MLELIAKIMLLVGIGGLVGLFAYHQFKTEGLHFRPLFILREVGLALKKAVLALGTAASLVLARLRQLTLMLYALLQPATSKAFQALQGRSQRTVKQFTQRAGEVLQALGQMAGRGAQLIIRELKHLKERRPARVSIKKSQPPASPRQEYDQLLQDQEEPQIKTQASRLEPLQQVLEERRQKLQAQRELMAQQKAEAENSERSQDILKEKERALLKEVAERPKDISLYKRLGFLYMELGWTDGARQSFETALKLGSQDSQIKEQLERL